MFRVEHFRNMCQNELTLLDRENLTRTQASRLNFFEAQIEATADYIQHGVIDLII